MRRHPHNPGSASGGRSRRPLSDDPLVRHAGDPRRRQILEQRHLRLREQRRRATQRALYLQIAALVTVVSLLVGIVWTVTRDPAPTAASGQAHAGTVAELADKMAVAKKPPGDPTPFFARYRSLHLYLPIPPGTLTEIAFHQASSDVALHMESLLPDADMGTAASTRGTGRVKVVDQTAGPAELKGEVLRMWRSNRTGPPDTAVDIGAAPGTPVFAPVTGTVVEVRAYRLYDKHDDYEIHIQPAGWPEIDVVLIHVDAPCVEAGDQVFGGLTQIAEVRRLSDRVDHQLGGYTADGGDHVHIQLNRTAVPGRLDGLTEGS